MLLKCLPGRLENRHSRIFRIAEGFASGAELVPETEYIAYGMMWKEDRLEVLVNSGDFDRPDPAVAPLDMFRVVDGKQPNDWYFDRIGSFDIEAAMKRFVDGSDSGDNIDYDNPELTWVYYLPDAIWGYYDLVYRPVHLSGLRVGVRGEVDIFRRRIRDMSHFYSR